MNHQLTPSPALSECIKSVKGYYAARQFEAEAAAKSYLSGDISLEKRTEFFMLIQSRCNAYHLALINSCPHFEAVKIARQLSDGVFQYMLSNLK